MLIYNVQGVLFLSGLILSGFCIGYIFGNRHEMRNAFMRGFNAGLKNEKKRYKY